MRPVSSQLILSVGAKSDMLLGRPPGAYRNLALSIPAFVKVEQLLLIPNLQRAPESKSNVRRLA